MGVIGEVEFTIVPDILTSLKILVIIITTDKLQVSHSPFVFDGLLYREVDAYRTVSYGIVVCVAYATSCERIVHSINLTR